MRRKDKFTLRPNSTKFVCILKEIEMNGIWKILNCNMIFVSFSHLYNKYKYRTNLCCYIIQAGW